MRLKFATRCIFSMLFLITLCGAVPVARIGSNIEENAIIEAGDPLEFEADSLTEKERCQWEVTPAFTLTGKPTHKLTIDNLKRPAKLAIYSRTAAYTLTLYVWNDDGLAKVVKTITVGKPTIIVGPIPPIPPKPIDPIITVDPKPVPPDPLPVPLGLSPIIANAVRLNVPASERAFASKLAENYRIGATNIAKGTWPVATAIKSQLDMNNKTPGYKPELWRPVGKDIADRLAEAKDAGKFETQAHYVAIWSEISFSFAEVAK